MKPRDSAERGEPLRFHRVVVTGGTRWLDVEALESELDRVSASARADGASFRVVTGMADGADAIARAWARRTGVGLFAEPLAGDGGPGSVMAYNDRLLALEPDLVLAFKERFADSWRSPSNEAGTEHMCRIAADAGVPVRLNGHTWLSAPDAQGEPRPRSDGGDAAAVHVAGALLRAHVGDITKESVDVVVNAANSSLLGGGGVDGAIHRAAGPALLDECRAVVARQGGCDVSQCVLTGAGEMPARHVVHTVGPVWTGQAPDEHDAALAACYAGALDLASTVDATSIAFPCISTGVYRFPKDRAAAVAVRAARAWAERGGGSVKEIRFVCFGEADFDLYRALLT